MNSAGLATPENTPPNLLAGPIEVTLTSAATEGFEHEAEIELAFEGRAEYLDARAKLAFTDDDNAALVREAKTLEHLHNFGSLSPGIQECYGFFSDVDGQGPWCLLLSKVFVPNLDVKLSRNKTDAAKYARTYVY